LRTTKARLILPRPSQNGRIEDDEQKIAAKCSIGRFDLR